MCREASLSSRANTLDKSPCLMAANQRHPPNESINNHAGLAVGHIDGGFRSDQAEGGSSCPSHVVQARAVVLLGEVYDKY